jgi:hypothetical protein
MMEQKVNIWKANFTNGMILALVCVVYTLLLYFFDLLFNQTLGYVFLLVQIILVFLLVKSYRDNILHGYITYGQAVGTGVVISLYSAVVMAVFTYILYTVLDPGLTAKKLAFIEEMMLKKGVPQSTVDTTMTLQEKLQTPLISSILSIFTGLLGGTILSLIIAIFVKKEGNPLLDAPEN